jgi:hypothetical protein
MESKVTLTGPGPFHLTGAQQATAAGHKNNGVTLTLKGLFRNGRELEDLSFQLTTNVARELAAALLVAAKKSEG